jgi:glycosyltransferase involved in cell wall biosynthesis
VLISVVVPTKGRAGHLENCLSALALAQYPDERFEVVVVNDGRSEEIERVVSSAADRLRARSIAPNRGGPSGARNAGAWAAGGDFIAFTDDDCEPAPGWLAALERRLTAARGTAVGGRTVNGAPSDTGAVASQIVVDAVHAHFNRDPAASRFFASYNLAFPAEEFRLLGGFDPELRYAEDRELCERWVRAGHRFAYEPAALVRHMRTLTLREFAAQHYGYGRGAWAVDRRAGLGAERPGVLRALVDRARANRVGPAVAGYLLLSQAATAAGFAREAVGRRVSCRSAGKRVDRTDSQHR